MHTPYQRGEEKSGAPWNKWGGARRGAPFMPRKALDFPQARRDKGLVPHPVDIFSPGSGGVLSWTLGFCSGRSGAESAAPDVLHVHARRPGSKERPEGGLCAA